MMSAIAAQLAISLSAPLGRWRERFEGKASSAKYLGEGTSRGEQWSNPLLPFIFYELVGTAALGYPKNGVIPRAFRPEESRVYDHEI